MTILSGSIQNLLLYITTILIWGSSWLAIKLQLGYVDPMVSVAYRFLLASGISWIYCRYSGRLMRFGLRDHLFMFLQGTCLFSLNYLLFYISELTLTSGLAAVIFSNLVVMNMLNGIIFLKNRFEVRMGVGASLGLAGILMVFWPEITDFEMGDENLSAAAIAVLATIGIIDTGSITFNRWGLLGPLTCPGGAEGCDKVLNSPWGTLFVGNNISIPLSFLGFISYLTVLVMAILPLLPGIVENKADLSRRTWWGLFLTTCGMTVFSLLLIGLMLFKIEAFCAFCLLSACI